jgi:hypothetical protein
MDPILARSLLMFGLGLGLIALGVLLSPLTLLDHIPHRRSTPWV